MDLDFRVIQKELGVVGEYYYNVIDREGVATVRHDAAPFVFKTLAWNVRHGLKIIFYNIAEVPEEFERKPEYMLLMPPLLRVLCDAAILITSLRNNTPYKLERYVQGGYKEAAEELKTYKELFLGKPEWGKILESREKGLAKIAEKGKIQTRNPAELDYFPHTSQLVRMARLKDEWFAEKDGAFVMFIYDWFYRSFSQQAHLSFEGLLKVGSGIALLDDKENREKNIPVIRTAVSISALSLFLVFYSELELLLENNGVGRQKLKYLWRVLREHSPDIKDIFERRYQERL